jgi:hypothetical protein
MSDDGSYVITASRRDRNAPDDGSSPAEIRQTDMLTGKN